MADLTTPLVPTATGTNTPNTTTGSETNTPGTVAAMTDGSDATFASASHTGDGLDEGVGSHSEGSAITALALTTGSYIERVRVKARARKVQAAADILLQAFFGSVAQGAAQALTTSFVDYSWDFTTNPATGLPWTQAEINAITDWGWFSAEDSNSIVASATIRVAARSVDVLSNNPGSVALSGAASIGVAAGAALTMAGLGSVALTGAAVLGLSCSAPNPTAIQHYPDRRPLELAVQPTAPSVSVGITSKGRAYFALATEADFSGFSPGPPELTIIMRLDRAPTQLADPDEIHIIASCHEGGADGQELFSLGITPTLRLCAVTPGAAPGSTPLLSQPGVVPLDGQFHVYQLFASASSAPTVPPHFTRWLRRDETLIVEDFNTVDAHSDGISSLTGKRLRFMLFNGLDGSSRVPCTISAAQIGNAILVDDPSERQAVWLLNEGSGDVANGYLTNTPIPFQPWNDITLEDPETHEPFYSGSAQNLDLVPMWYSPPTGLPWGPVPGSGLNGAWSWNTGTQYHSRTRTETVFRKRTSTPSDYVPRDDEVDL